MVLLGALEDVVPLHSVEHDYKAACDENVWSLIGNAQVASQYQYH